MPTLTDLVLDLIFPRHCLGCEILLSNEPSYLCRQCLTTIVFKNSFACAFCNSPVVAGKTCHFCQPHHFLDGLLVTTAYDNPLVEKILKTLKYQFVKTLADEIGKIMANYLKKIYLAGKKPDRENILIAPVPLHWRRLNWRGFNQSEIIAAGVSRILDLQFEPQTLKRDHKRKPQAEIKDKKSRIENMAGVFECLKPSAVDGKTILLIDDVATTGSTLDDCARALKSAGAKEVIGFVFARG